MRRFRNRNVSIPLLAAVLLLTRYDFDVSAAEPKAKGAHQERSEPGSANNDKAHANLSKSTRAERVLERKPGDRGARIQAARAYLDEGADDGSRVDEAKEHVLAVLAEHPNDMEALLLAGQTSLLKSDPWSAARYYRAATLVNASNATAFLGLGDALTRIGDDASATAAFARYRELMGMPPLQSPAESK